MKVLSVLAAAALAVTVPSLAQAKGGVTFLVAGNTEGTPFSFTNTSDAGEKIVGFGFDLRTVTTGRTYYFDTVGGSSIPFAAVGGSGVTTGLVSSPVVPDEARVFSLAFADFDVGETFQFSIDIDSTVSNLVSGRSLVGARIWFDFDNGERVAGFLQAIPDSPGAAFAPVPEPSTWALLIGGFGLAGATLRQRRRSILPAA